MCLVAPFLSLLRVNLGVVCVNRVLSVSLLVCFNVSFHVDREGEGGVIFVFVHIYRKLFTEAT